MEQTRSYFARPSRITEPRDFRYDMAILWQDTDAHAPSEERAIKKFIRAAREVGIGAEIVGPEDYGSIAEFDALFIRETTSVDHHTYRFARRAAAEGLVVIDDPESIIRCTNKVYQAELFDRYEIPRPKTLVVHEGNVDEVEPTVGLPCVLKRPDGAFSSGVHKVSTQQQLEKLLPSLFEESELVVAQEWAPSAFDWRIGVLDKKPLWVCKYHMAPGHWQIIHKEGKGTQFGRVEAIELEDAPPEVVALGVRAASLIGDGLYGVDVKEVDGRFVVMEVNDNPSIDSGFEDALLKDRLYLTIMEWFRDRLDARGATGNGASASDAASPARNGNGGQEGTSKHGNGRHGNGQGAPAGRNGNGR
jgi:glutathione synthase/RimK-type ligase-like ATP-grasp enzyme